MIGGHGGYELVFIENLKAGKTQILFTDEVRSVEQVETVAEKLIKALNFEGGIYHLGGPKALNRYELGLQLAQKYELGIALIKAGVQADMKMPAARPKNVSMIENV